MFNPLDYLEFLIIQVFVALDFKDYSIIFELLVSQNRT